MSSIAKTVRTQTENHGVNREKVVKGLQDAEEELCEIAYRFGERDDWFCADGECKKMTI